MEDLLPGLVEWVRDVIGALGYVGVAVLTALETVFPPIPSEIVLPLAGSLIDDGRFSFVWLVVAATVGSVAGATVLYGLGWWIKPDRLTWLVRRFGRYALIDEDDLDRAQGWFDRHGGKAVLIGRCVPGIRSLISIPAGIERMPVGRFLGYTAVGSAIWNGALIGVGWVLGEQWHRVQDYVEILEYLVIGVAVVLVGWFLRRRMRSPNRA